MKYILILLWLTILFPYPSFAFRTSSKERYGLVGPVCSVYSEVAMSMGQRKEFIPEEYSPVNIEFFDKHGNLFGRVNFHANRSTRSYDVWIDAYDENGNLTQMIMRSFDENGEPLYEHKTDEIMEIISKEVKVEFGGKIVETTTKVKGEIFEKTIEKFDRQGRRTELSVYDPDGSLYTKTQYKYGSDGNIIERLSSYRGLMDDRTVYTRDRMGRILKLFRYSDVDSFTYSHSSSFAYDDVGNWLTKIDRNSLGDIIGAVNRSITYYLDGEGEGTCMQKARDMGIMGHFFYLNGGGETTE